MRLNIRLLGTEVLNVSTDPEAAPVDDDRSRDLSGGTTYASPMGFTARMEKPHEVDTPDRDW